MQYPKLKKKSVKSSTVNIFTGYEHRLKTSEGAFYDTENMSSELCPMLTVRKRRGKYLQLSNPQGFAGRDALCWVDDGTLWYNGSPTPLVGMSAGEKQLVSMGAYICVFPDKLYYNTVNAGDFGSMEAHWSYSGRVTYSMCNIDGEDYPAAYESAGTPANPVDGEYRIDSTEGTLSRYSAATGIWTQIESVYTKLTFTSMGQLPDKFSALDGVEISGLSVSTLNGQKLIYAMGGEKNGESDYIVLAGELCTGMTRTEENVIIARKVPDMDFVCQCANRLWGCRYGNDGAENINELYCCALGDFKNWSRYQGLSTDSWRASVGSDGVWTGAVSYLGSPIFFKENCIHRIGISSVGAHQVSETICRGVQRGSEKSLAVVNETLYYKSRGDICAYQGGFPESVSAALGDTEYFNAAAGALGQRYYISMLDADDKSNLFVLDISKGIWMREDALRADGFACVDGELFCLSGNVIWAMRGSCGEPEGRIEWSAETGMLGCEYAGKKYLGRILLRAWMEQEAEAELFTEYDSSGVWEYAGRMRILNAGTAEFPLRLRRCDHVRIRIKGRGEIKLMSLTREVTEG